MTDVVIKVENLGKKYMIGHQAENGRNLTLRDVLAQNARTFWQKTRDLARGKPIVQGDTLEEVWALNDVSFEIRRGEAVGIIGRNGAGKSTLLKILSRITEPSTGRVTIKGRVASLLEVGTGFHSELSGRENIYLNGAILGMTRSEIKRKFDEVVAFAEVERFLDTPVKRYSSGMYVRLAFAVAAHLEPEILIVDEVLAVGDVGFQKKCLGKMSDVAGQGRTVLFVSHNMPAITRLCPRAFLLEQGKLIDDDHAARVIGRHVRSDTGNEAYQQWSDVNSAPGDDTVRLLAVRIKDAQEQTVATLDIRDPIRMEMEYQVLAQGAMLRPWIILRNDEGICVFATTDTDREWIKQSRTAGVYCSSVTIPANFLAEGGFTATVGIATTGNIGDHFIVNDAAAFQVIDSLDGNSARGEYGGSFPGVVRPWLPWTTAPQFNAHPGGDN